MYIKKEISPNDLDDILWSGAREKWCNATDEQKSEIWSLLEDMFYQSTPELTTINDFIWFECDSIFYPEREWGVICIAFTINLKTY